MRPGRGRGVGVAALAAVLWAAAAGAQTALPPPRPEIGPERPFRPAPRLERTMPNGLQVVVVPHRTVPKVTLTLVVRSGSAADPGSLPGVASLVADAVQEGTASRSSQAIREEAFAMGGSLTASASPDYTAISLRGLSRFVPGLLDLLADVAIRPSFPEEEVELLRANLEVALSRQAASPQFVANREFRRALLGEHPYAHVSTTREALVRLTRERLVEFHTSHYRPNHAFLLVVGDVAPEAVFEAASTAFGGWEPRKVPEVSLPDPPGLEGRQVVFVQRPGSVQTSIVVGNPAVPRDDPRWYAMLLANVIYGGAFDSRIIQNIREDKGYTYSPLSQFVALESAGFYRFAADVRSEVTRPTLTEVFGEIDLLRREGPEARELEAAKQFLRGLFVIGSSTQAGLSSLLTTIYAFGLPRDYPETYQARISALSQTDVLEGARELLGSADSVIVMVGDYDLVKDQLEDYGEIVFYDVDGRPLDSPPS